MEYETKQLAKWSGDFGRHYAARNPQNVQELEDLYAARFGTTRRTMNEEFLGQVGRNARILEVGCNIGNQLALLREMGFTELCGLEVSPTAFEAAKRRPETEGVSFVRGSAFDLPFRDGHFDLVFTSGVLIHIAPEDIGRAMAEVTRCSKRYVWGFEYFGEGYQEVPYRGERAMLWKTDFSALYRRTVPALEVVLERRYPYAEDPSLVDQMFLLRKRG